MKGKEFKILNYQEEQSLTEDEFKIYLKKLKSFLLESKHDNNLSKGSLSLCPRLNKKIIRKILEIYANYDLEIDNDYIFPEGPVIYAFTHHSKYDHVNAVLSLPKHSIILNSSVLSKIYRIMINANGVVYVDKEDKQSRNNAKVEVIRLLLNGYNVTVFPESTWNLSPNKLHLNCDWGIIDMARKTGVPIIPVVQYYCYDDKKMDKCKEKVTKVKIKYGSPIYVSDNDNYYNKINEYCEEVATIMWDLYLENGSFKRDEVNVNDYINFLKTKTKNLRKAGIDVNVERQGIYNSKSDFYLFHHINDIEYDEDDNLLPTEYVRKITKVNKQHFCDRRNI